MTKLERNKLIFKLHKEGNSQIKLGDLFNLSQSAISKIIINFPKSQEIPLRENRGAQPKLGIEELKELKDLLNESPQSYSYTVWDKWSVKSLIQAQFGVIYHQNYIYKIMKKIGFSSQKPKLKDYRQSPVKVQEFKEQKIDEIKKSEGR